MFGQPFRNKLKPHLAEYHHSSTRKQDNPLTFPNLTQNLRSQSVFTSPSQAVFKLKKRN